MRQRQILGEHFRRRNATAAPCAQHRSAGDGVKLNAICDKHGLLLDPELVPTNTDDRIGALPMRPRLAEPGFPGDLLGGSGWL